MTPELKKMYNSAAWKNARKLQFHRNPICEQNPDERTGRPCTSPATVVDHKKPHRGNWELFMDAMNLQSMCKHHHDKKTATQDGGLGNRPKDPNDVTPTGEPGKQFTSGSVSASDLDRALEDDSWTDSDDDDVGPGHRGG